MATIPLKIQLMGGGINKFLYKDKFGRGGWLNMMKVRLKLAKDLLTPEGVIFCSIDDTEQAYLKVLMDEIFGENNFLNQINWISKKSGRQISGKPFAKTYEYILVYTKSLNISNKKFNKINRNFLQKSMSSLYLSDISKKNEEEQKNKKINDDYIIGNSLHNTNIKKFNKNTRPNLFFPIFINLEKKLINTIQPSNKNFETVFPPKNQEGVQGVWRWSKKKIEKDKKLLILSKNNFGKIFIKTKRYDYDYLLKDTIMGSQFSTRSGNAEIARYNLDFSNPKPTMLLKLLFQVILDKNKTSFILDFFAGSGSVGDAVLQINREMKSSHKFILVTNNENNIAYNIAYERLHRIIQGKAFDKEKLHNIPWLTKNQPFTGIKLRVIEIDDAIKISLTENVAEVIYQDCKKGLQLLNGQYKKDNLNLYYDLAALNPLESEEDQF